ncbi:MAG: hypothetical protein KIT72_09825 [Polyangiaceae bacterium]|nr:hypothetical protein [Polyangiaceae bacterium]MCW5790707.1 hypothetical protein [Polyangiaceae bacterium]
MSRVIRLTAFLGLALGFTLGGCPAPEKQRPEVRASFGIFYGGQVQERDEIPFEIDRAKQSQGFRLEFPAPLAAARRVTWEVDQPAPRGKRPTPTSRITALGEAEVRPGTDRLEVPLELAPGDPLGEWNIRVLVDGELVLDQRFALYSAAARARAQRSAEEQAEDDE